MAMEPSNLFMGNHKPKNSDFIVNRFIDYPKRNEESYVFNLDRLRSVLIKGILSTEGNLASLSDIELLTTRRFNDLSFSCTLDQSDIEEVWAMDRAIKYMEENFYKPLTRDIIEDYNYLVVIGYKKKYSGRIRQTDVVINGSVYKPPSFQMLDRLFDNMLSEIGCIDGDINKAISLILGISKLQLFIDGNKRTALLCALHHLCYSGQPLLIMQDRFTKEYLIRMKKFYETGENEDISNLIFKMLDTEL